MGAENPMSSSASVLLEHWEWLFVIGFTILLHWKTEAWKRM